MKEGQRKTEVEGREAGMKNKTTDSRKEKKRAGVTTHIERQRHRRSEGYRRERDNERCVLAKQTIYLSLLLPSAFLTQTQTIGYNCLCVFIRR